MRGKFAGLTLSLSLLAACTAYAGNTYQTVDISASMTEYAAMVDTDHGFKTFYTNSDVQYTLGGEAVPFHVLLDGLNMASTTANGTETIVFDAHNTPLGTSGNDKLYFLGLGSWLAAGLGHDGDLWCDPNCPQEHVAFEVHYTDGSFVHVFPTDAVSGLKRWSDVFYGADAVDRFDWWYGFDPIFGYGDGFIHAYEVALDPTKTVDYAKLIDTAGLSTVPGDYSIFAMTVQKTEAVPEPASVAVLGLGALALIRKRRSRW